MTHEPTVYLVDDDPTARSALRYLVESVGLAVVEFDDARTFLNEYDGARPCCLVLDMRMPGMSGLGLLDALNERYDALQIIIVTGHGDVPSAVRALQGGAADFLEKPFNSQVMLDRIQRCLECDIEREIHFRQREDVTLRFSTLTPRELEVLDLILAGKPNKSISSMLGISVKTVQVHRAHIMEKTGASNLAELLTLAGIASG